MIHTYKRKGVTFDSCSFYERLCGDSLDECSASTTPVEGHIPNGCYLRETKEGKCGAWSDCDLPNNNNFLRSPSSGSVEAPPIKFKYTRRPKQLCSGERILHYDAELQPVQEASHRMSEMTSMRLDLDKIGCVSSQSKLTLADQSHDIPRQDTAPCSDDLSSGKQYNNTYKCMVSLENAGLLCHDPCSRDHCITVATDDPTQINSGSPELFRCGDGSFCSQISNNEENGLSPVCSNISAKRDYESISIGGPVMPESDCQGRNGSDGSRSCTLVEAKLAAPLHTYSRRPRKQEDTHRIYVNSLAERNNNVKSGQSIYGSAESLEHETLPKMIELRTPETVVEHNPSFSQSCEQLADGTSAVGAMISGQGNEKEINGCQLIKVANVNKIPSLNDEAVADQQPDDAINSSHAICDLSLHTAYEECSTDAEMKDTFETTLENSKNHSSGLERAGRVSKDFSVKPYKVDCNLAANTDCEEEAVGHPHSEALKHYAERNHDALLPAEAPRANSKQLSEIMNGGVTGAIGPPGFNVQPSIDGGFISQMNKMVCSIPLPNGSTNGKVLQLFPEDITDHALLRSTSISELVPAVTYSNSSVSMAPPDLSIGCRQFFQAKMSEPSSNQAGHKLLLDSIRSWNRPQPEATKGFRQNFQPFASLWSEEELDNLWVGVRRHGKDNWFALLRDPKLRFSPWRTARDLAEKWVMEQTKLLGNTPGPQHQHAKPVGVQMSPPFVPPSPGFMTRFLTEPTQLSNAYLNNQGMTPPRPLHNVTKAPGNGTRLFNRRVTAHRRSQHSESTRGRFKARNQVMSPLEFPTLLASTSRNDILPSCVRDALDHPQPRLPLPTPPLTLQHSGNLSRFNAELNNKVLCIPRRNGIHSSNAGADCPGITCPIPNSQPSESYPPDTKRPEELINLESDASSEGTISDDNNPNLICKYN